MTTNEIIHERIMGKSLNPCRDVALVSVGWKHIVGTGPIFILKGGREIEMPDGENLRKPEGVSDWNARYALHVAEVLGDEIKDEVESYREKAPDYEHDIELAYQVIQRLAEKKFNVEVFVGMFERVSVYETISSREHWIATCERGELAKAICEAAIKSLESDSWKPHVGQESKDAETSQVD